MEQFLPEFGLERRRPLPDDFEPLPRLRVPDLEREYPVFRSYLDVNRHVTSTAYVLWALETTPEDVLLALRPAEIEVNYRGETFYGDRIVSRSQRLPDAERPTFLHTLLRAGDGKELAVLRTVWADL
jgi:acyl-ACP thioesterase